MDDFLANEAKGTKVIGAHSLEEMVSKLKKPRRIILLVKAGNAVDDFINKLVRETFFPPVTSWLSFGKVSSGRSHLFVVSEVLNAWRKPKCWFTFGRCRCWRLETS